MYIYIYVYYVDDACVWKIADLHLHGFIPQETIE